MEHAYYKFASTVFIGSVVMACSDGSHGFTDEALAPPTAMDGGGTASILAANVGSSPQASPIPTDRLLGLPQCARGGPCQQLNVGDELMARNGKVTLNMQSDGNLVIYDTDNGSALWSSQTAGKPANHAPMQWDGNFVLYGPSGAYWSTGTWNHPGADVVLQDDGNLVVYDVNGQSLWASNTARTWDRLIGLPQCARGGPCQQLNIGDFLTSPNRKFTLNMRSDGNLVLYRTDTGGTLWASNTAGEPADHAPMQWDGNFVLYGSGGAYWSTGTWGHPGAYIVLQDDGNLVVYDVNGNQLWATNTVQDCTTTGCTGGNVCCDCGPTPRCTTKLVCNKICAQ